MRKRYVLILVLIISVSSLYSQGEVLWNRVYGGIGNEGINSMIQTQDGGYAIAAYTTPSGVNYNDNWLIKTDINGDTLWTKNFGTDEADFPLSIIQTQDGGLAIAGTTNDLVGSYNGWLMKTDIYGETLWSKIYNGKNNIGIRSIVQTNDGGFIMGGSTAEPGIVQDDFFLIRTDMNGDTLWTKTYGGDGFEYARCIIQTQDGGYAITGFTSSYGAGKYDIWLIKTDVNGDSLWTKTFGGIKRDEAYSIIQTQDGGYAIAGSTQSFGAGLTDVWVIKTDVNGDTLWTKTYGGASSDEANDIIPVQDGGYTIAGSTFSFGNEGKNIWLINTDYDGNTLWTKTYGGNENDYANCIIHTLDGGYAIGGQTYSYGAGSSDAWLIKTIPPNSTVYPGDTNNDGVVDELDILPIGVYFLEEGASRTDASNVWEGQDVTSWSTYPANFADCNGDGVVDEKDIIAVGINWGSVRSSSIQKHMINPDDKQLLTKHMDAFETIYHSVDGLESASAKAIRQLLETTLEIIPKTITLYPCYPNPFNPGTEIGFNLPASMPVSLKVYNMKGHYMTILINNAELEAGYHKITFNGESYPSGMYIYVLETENSINAQKMMLIK